MRFALAFALMILVLVVGGCSKDATNSPAAATTAPSGGWKEFDPEQGKFTIKMPGDPAPMPADGTVTNCWGVTAGGVTYSIGYSELSSPATLQSQDQIEKNFDALTEIMPITDHVEVDETLTKKQISFAGVSGRELTGMTDDKKLTRMRLGIVGDRRYRAAVTGSNDAVNSNDAEAFFNSLKIAR